MKVPPGIPPIIETITPTAITLFWIDSTTLLFLVLISSVIVISWEKYPLKFSEVISMELKTKAYL